MESVSTLPVFALDGVFLCPGLLLPLHIFESRYRDMLAYALAGSRRIAMSHPGIGHSTRDQYHPPLHEVCGVGEIVEHHTFTDGRANVLLRGESRMRILEELPKSEEFRLVRAARLPEELPPDLDLAAEIADLRIGMERAGAGLLHMPAGASVQQIVDVALVWLPLAAEIKLGLYSEPRVDLRLRGLLDQLPTGGRPDIEIGRDDPRRN